MSTSIDQLARTVVCLDIQNDILTNHRWLPEIERCTCWWSLCDLCSF